MWGGNPRHNVTAACPVRNSMTLNMFPFGFRRIIAPQQWIIWTFGHLAKAVNIHLACLTAPRLLETGNKEHLVKGISGRTTEGRRLHSTSIFCERNEVSTPHPATLSVKKIKINAIDVHTHAFHYSWLNQSIITLYNISCRWRTIGERSLLRHCSPFPLI